jgi:hypothetical protein
MSFDTPTPGLEAYRGEGAHFVRDTRTVISLRVERVLLLGVAEQTGEADRRVTDAAAILVRLSLRTRAGTRGRTWLVRIAHARAERLRDGRVRGVPVHARSQYVRGGGVRRVAVHARPKRLIGGRVRRVGCERERTHVRSDARLGRVGQRAAVSVDTFPKREFPGRVVEIRDGRIVKDGEVAA